MPNLLADTDDMQANWALVTDSILLHVFQYLGRRELLTASEVCKKWYKVAQDEFLWKDLLYQDWNIDRSIARLPQSITYKSEYIRLYYHTPCVESEVLANQHADQVLHVAFSHNGAMFSTASKDGFVKVWNATYPTSLRHSADMRDFTWKYTQSTQFNATDTLLLVSGVHFGSHSISGEIAIFTLQDGFLLQCRVLNKPYDVFGTWYNDEYLLSGNLHWMGNLASASVIWLNKASQALDSENESVVMKLFKFHNVNASTVRMVLVAQCLTPPQRQGRTEDNASEPVAMTTETRRARALLRRQQRRGLQVDAAVTTATHGSGAAVSSKKHGRRDEVTGSAGASGDFQQTSTGLIPRKYRRTTSTTKYNPNEEDYSESSCSSSSSSDAEYCGENDGDNVYDDWLSAGLQYTAADPQYTAADPQCTAADSPMSTSAASTADTASVQDKYLIYTKGSLTYTPHQVAIKRISMRRCVAGRLIPDAGSDLPSYNNASADDSYDQPDCVFEMHGHITGMALSPDDRYLYVNNRAWPPQYTISDPLEPPPIAEQVEVHVIDLVTLTHLGIYYTAARARTPNDECFFIFLNVSQHYVASGAEDNKAYVWDRHYRCCLHTCHHSDVVNSVAICPTDEQTMVTASDDGSFKVWRSRYRVKQLLSAKMSPSLTQGLGLSSEGYPRAPLAEAECYDDSDG